MTHPRIWHVGHGRRLDLGRPVIMGILNVTPDSFSDGGHFIEKNRAIAQAERMIDEGATIIDVGGESTRPDAKAVSPAQEQDRILPVIEALAQRGNALISADTYRPETARLAIEAGCHIVNDVTGLSGGLELAQLAAATGSGLVIMHTGRGRERLPDPMEDQLHFLGEALAKARAAGVADAQIVIDPGFGFAKETAEANLDIIARFEELHRLGPPLAVGTSRKRFIGTVTGRPPDERDAATAATSVLLRLKGAHIFRVHDVRSNMDALLMTEAVSNRMGSDRT